MSTEHNMDHMNYLEAVAAADVAHLREKERTYRGSWKRRGGVGSYMMLARKMDRLEGMMDPAATPGDQREAPCSLSLNAPVGAWDIFAAIAAGSTGVDGTPLAEVRDLRRYLLLVEAEMVARGAVRYSEAAGKISIEPDYIPVLRAPGFSDCQQPATRTDSNRHAAQEYLMDGLKREEYVNNGPWILYAPGTPQAIINRTLYYARGLHSEIDHLPRLAVELNAKEHEETLPEYRWMYDWYDGKFRMREAYRELWGKQ